MAGTALRGRLTWQIAELVNAVAETPRVKTIVFDVPGGSVNLVIVPPGDAAAA
jgi:hypothetical protein